MSPRRLFLPVLATTLGVLAFTAAPVLAAAPAPEAPTTGAVGGITGTSATFEGVLNPGTLHEAAQAGSYEFLFKKVANGAGCEGESATPAGGMSGLPEQPVSEPVGLEPDTEYAVCLAASNEAAERTVGNEVSFKTKALKPKVTLGSEKVAPAGVSSTKATFEATIDPNNEPTTYGFEYATSEAALLGGAGTTVAGTLPPTLEGDSEVPIGVTTETPLSPGTTYYYRVVAQNEQSGTEGKPAYGPMQSFATVSTPVTDPASTPVGATTATLNGELALNPDFASQYHFEYTLGPACAGENSTPSGEAGKGSATVAESAEIKGLQPNAEYTVCFVTANEFGSEVEATSGKHFTTAGAPPTVDSEGASPVSASGVTLEAQIDPENETTGYTFEYSTKEKNGVLEGTIVKVAGSLAAAFGDQPASAALTGLEAGKTYFYRVVAENAQSKTEAGNPVVGKVQSFTTVPAPVTEEAKAITATTATFYGTLTPLNSSVKTEYFFDYKTGPVGEACTGQSATTPAGAGAGAGSKAVSTEVSELQPDQEYSVCLVSKNPFGEEVDPAPTPKHFKTLAAAPVVSEGSETTSGVTPFEATLEAQVNPDNESTSYTFEYATSEAVLGTPGATKLTGGPLTGYGPQTASVATGHLLTPDTPYYYRVVASNGTPPAAQGAVASFTTEPVAPPEVIAGSESATPASSNEATFTASINTNDEETSYAFEYATKATGQTLEGTIETIPDTSSLPGAPGEQAASVSTGPVLEAGETYYYRVVATNKTGTTTGKVEQFTKNPKVEAESSAVSSATAATLNATVNPDYQITKYTFEYATNAALTGATKVPGTSSLPAEFAGLPVSTSLTGLQPGVTYYYRVVADNETTKKTGKPEAGNVESFTTVLDYTLQIAKTGNSGGTVTSTPAAIDCGATCSAAFEANTQVTLTASPVAGSQFVGWTGGGCTGTGECTVTLTAATTVTAEFRQPSPVVVTEAASAVTAATANVTGQVSPEGAPTETCEFEYGPTTAYGSVADCAANPGSGTAYAPVAATLENLAGRTTYHYRLVAKNAAGVTDGTDMQFTTPESPAEVAAEAAAKQQQEAAAARKAQEEAAAAANAAAQAKATAEAKAASEAKAAAEAKAKAEAEAKKQREAAAAAAKKKKQAEEKAKKKKKQKKKKKKAKSKKKGRK